MVVEEMYHNGFSQQELACWHHTGARQNVKTKSSSFALAYIHVCKRESTLMASLTLILSLTSLGASTRSILADSYAVKFLLGLRCTYMICL